MLYRCKSLVASLQALAVFDVQMLEANRAKAPKERIAYIPGTSRTAIVQGAK